MVSESKPLEYEPDGSEEDEVREMVVDHLFFHRSIIDDHDSGDRLQEYIDMVKRGEHEDPMKFSSDPLESSVANIFRLVIQERLNPWEIDLVSFTELYLEKARSDDDINFIVAGKLVSMAWSILSMQCQEVLSGSADGERVEEECHEYYDDFAPPWDLFDHSLYSDPEDIDFEDSVLHHAEPVLERVVRRQDSKPISLVQLIGAFEEASRESRYREKLERLREEKSAQRKLEDKMRKEDYDSTAHKEDIDEDIKTIWKRICWYKQDTLEFGILHDDGVRDLITAFVSLLFLHRDGKIKVRQAELPYGQIMVKNLVPEAEREEYAEEASAEKEELDLEVCPSVVQS